MKSQMSLEYVMTYSWVMFMILITLGVITYLFFTSKPPESCTFPNVFDCTEFAIVGNEINIVLENSLGKDIVLRGISVNVTDGDCAVNPAIDAIRIENLTGLPLEVGFTKTEDILWKANARKHINITCTDVIDDYYVLDILVSYTENKLTTGVRGTLRFEG